MENKTINQSYTMTESGPNTASGNDQELLSFLKKINLDELNPGLVREGVDLDVLSFCTSVDELQSLGIGKAGHRIKLLWAVTERNVSAKSEDGQLLSFLEKLDLRELYPGLESEGVDLDVLSFCTSVDELQSLGINKAGHRIKLLRAVKEGDMCVTTASGKCILTIHCIHSPPCYRAMAENHTLRLTY